MTAKQRLIRLVAGGLVSGPVVAHLGLAVLRVFAGLSLALAHGIHKLPPAKEFVQGVDDLGFPVPLFWAWCAALSEFLGGLLLALGLLTRPAALLVGTTMATAALLQHADDPYSVKEKALLYLFIAFVFLLVGCGRFGFDRLLRAAGGR